MTSLRIGTDRVIIWDITYKGVPYDLTGKDIILKVSAPNYSFIVPQEEFTISGNSIVWTFKGKDQKQLGPHTLTITENAGQEGMMTFDCRNAFCFVAFSEQEFNQDPDNMETSAIKIESDLATLRLLLVSEESRVIMLDTLENSMIARRFEEIGSPLTEDDIDDVFTNVFGGGYYYLLAEGIGDFDEIEEGGEHE